MIDPMELSASELAAAIRAGEISPREAVEAALAHIEARAALNAFVTLRAEAARNEAMDAAARLTRGDEPPPLLGVPFAATDLLSTAGVRTTMGSRLNAASVPNEDAVAVARMKSAGAILIGKTTTAEFGHKPFANSALSGRTLNPWNNASPPARTAGRRLRSAPAWRHSRSAPARAAPSASRRPAAAWSD